VAALVVLVGCCAILATSALTYTDPVAASAASSTAETNVTFVSTQGRLGTLGEGRIVAFDTDRRTAVWTHTAYDRYFDVDPMGNDRLLFAAVEAEPGVGAGTTYAVVVNWRTGERVERFRVAPDVHDVDYLGDGEYLVADKFHHTVYVRNLTLGDIVWRYNFTKQFPASAGNGPPTTGTEYTHLNDVDPVDNGSAFLVSPRNFDRVVLINRSAERVEWTLGAQDDHSVLREQHNPTLVETDPPTVLVADSENDRVVEYTRTNGTWERTWLFDRGLNWPRDADRLPNGNTLVADTRNQRALEVDPNGSVVWEVRIPEMPYDAERLRHGDEPGGPTARSLGAMGTVDATESQSAVDWLGRRVVEVHAVARWVLPPWVSVADFVVLVVGASTLFGWVGAEAALRARPVVGRLRRVE